MIARLRRRHRVVTAWLGVILAIGVGASLLARRPATDDALPEALSAHRETRRELFSAHRETRRELWSADDLFSKLAIRTTALSGERDVAVSLTPLRDPALPDLLVYWSPRDDPGDDLPDGARFLGRLAGTRERTFPLPGVVDGELSGTLHLYSMGHGERVDHARLEGPR